VATQRAVRAALFDALRADGVGLPNPDVRVPVSRDADRRRDALGRGAPHAAAPSAAES
jgi:hypothetical protein